MALNAPGKCLSCTHKRMESHKQECMQLQRALLLRLLPPGQAINEWMKYLEQTCWRLTKIYEPTKLHAPVMRYWTMLWTLLVKGYWTMLWKLLVKAGMNASLLQYFGGWAENRVFLKFFFFPWFESGHWPVPDNYIHPPLLAITHCLEVLRLINRSTPFFMEKFSLLNCHACAFYMSTKGEAISTESLYQNYGCIESLVGDMDMI